MDYSKLPDTVADVLINAEAEGYRPSCEEFADAVNLTESEKDFWIEELRLPEVRESIDPEVEDEEYVVSPRTFEDELRERGMKLSDFI